jgi:flagellar biosynthesis protein FlhB
VAGEKTEKATPKKREDARKKGQVAKSQDLGGSLVTMAGLFALGAYGPAIAERAQSSMRQSFLQIADPSVVTVDGSETLLRDAGMVVVAAVAPLAFVCAIVALVVGFAQSGVRPMPGAIKPQVKKLNPISGAKNLLGPNAWFMLVQNLLKVAVVGAVAALVLAPQVDDFAQLVGAGPQELTERLGTLAMQIARWGTFGWVVLSIADFFWQRHRHEKNIKMDKQEVKDEAKNQDLPAEVKAQQRRRQMAAARARMMSAVPEADVVVTNPTHFAVALKYGSGMAAPEVIAKGQDIIALKIRAIAEEHGVPIVPDPPLARALHKGVEVGHAVPEDLYQAVAKVLAFVYRMAARKAV